MCVCVEPQREFSFEVRFSLHLDLAIIATRTPIVMGDSSKLEKDGAAQILPSRLLRSNLPTCSAQSFHGNDDHSCRNTHDTLVQMTWIQTRVTAASFDRYHSQMQCGGAHRPKV